MTTLSICSYNVHHRRTDAAIRRDISALIDRGCDVVCPVEMGGHLDAATDHPGWGLHMPQHEPGQASTPILWQRDTMRALGVGQRLIHGAEDVPAEAAGPETVSPKYLVRGRFLHKPSGQTVHVGNSHVVASNYLPEVRPLLARHMAVIADYTRRRPGGLVLLAGDYNATIKDDRFTEPLGVTDLVSNWESATAPDGGTKGPRAIDHILYIPYPRFRITAQETVKLGSDHKALIVTFALADR